MNTTVRVKASQIYKDWHVIDAAGRPLGRVASEAASLLKGKHKPTYEPHLDDGDFVIIVNAAQVKVTGRKREQKRYYRHSGYPGGLRTRTFVEQQTRFPDRVVEKAVWGMLPGGSLGEQILKHLKVYAGPRHPHESQIVGSERARAAREVALPPMPARLRPLSVPDSQLMEEIAEIEEALIREAREAPVAPVATPAAPEPVAAAPAAEPAVEPGTPKPARRRAARTEAAEAPTAEAAAPAEPKPARRRTVKTEAAEAPSAEAAATAEPKPARRTRKAAEAVAPETTESAETEE